MFLVVSITFVLLISLFCIIFTFNPKKRPFLTESDWTTHRSPWWQLYYSSKYLQPVKSPANDTIAELFNRSMAADPQRETLKESRTVTLKTVGDLMCRRDLIGQGGHDLWKHVGPYLFDADFVMGNLEFAVNPANIIEKMIRFSVTPAHAQPLLGDKRFGAFNLVSLANNHINDSHSQGIVSTCDYLDSIGLMHVGANRTASEQDQFPIVDINGVKTAFLSYTFSTNGIPLEEQFEFGTNLVRFNALDERDYDPSLILKQIKMAKDLGAELIVSCNHWGVEFEYFPPERLIERAHGLLEAGVDIIIGHHPHIINPVERYKTRDGRSTVVFYSLGNITSWALKHSMQKLSLIAEIEVERGLDSAGNKVVRIGDVSLMPVVHLFRKNEGVLRHNIFPLLKYAEMAREGNGADECTPAQLKKLVGLDKEFRRHFMQHGLNYI